MAENKSILHELYVFSEWKPEPEYLQKPDNILPENISALWRWVKFFGPKKSLIDSVTAHKDRQQKWHIALGDQGKVIAILTDNILEIRTKRSEYAVIAARTTVIRDAYQQWRKLVWSPDCSFLAVAYGNGIVSFFDLTASNLFNIPADCKTPGGLECTDNTHAVADIIFMPLRVKDNKWNWEVVVVTYDGKLRGYLVSQTDGFKLHHTFKFTAGGVSAVSFNEAHGTLYVAGAPHASKDATSPLSAGITAWRILNDEPFYKLSVVSDQLELNADRFHLYMPFVSSKNLAFIVHMKLSPDGSKLVCLHCNGDVSIWRLPLLKQLYRWPLLSQPQYDLDNPLENENKKKDVASYYAADVNWWNNEEFILSRFNGAVTVCDVHSMVNILGQKPEFFQGSPQVTCAYKGTFMVLECESNVLPAMKSGSEDSMEVVRIETPDAEDTMLEVMKELIKSMLYAITDIETFQPKPRKITVVSRVYRLLGVKSTTPDELFSRKIESGNYAEALALAKKFRLDSDLVYQQQWRKNTVSTDAIQKYLSKVSKKIWAVHQCVDRLPETLPAAKELLLFGLQLTNETILEEIIKDRTDDLVKELSDITLEDLNAYTSELLRCRHVMLFYKERLRLYEAILKCEKSTYAKDEYDRIRSNSIVHSAMEIAKEGRIEALTCLWPYIKTVAMQLAVLEKLPETINPLEYQYLLPTMQPMQVCEKKNPIKIEPSEDENDWCRKEIFRSIWSSNWSEDITPETETADITNHEDIAKWYEKRAREIEDRSGLVSHALTLITLATVVGAVDGLEHISFHLTTLDTLIYDINVEGVTLGQLENMSVLNTCKLLMQMSTPEIFVADLKQFVIPFLKRYENFSKRAEACINGLTEYLESISVYDLSFILLVLQSPSEFELDHRTHLELAERCLFAHTGTDQLDKACDLLDTILKVVRWESDGSISNSELVRRVKEIERLVSCSSRVSWRGVKVPPRDLRDMHRDPKHAHNLLTRVARSLATGDEKPTQQDWEALLKDILELQSTLFDCITKEQCHEIYASSLLTSGDAASIKLAAEVLTCEADVRRSSHLVNYTTSVDLVSKAAMEYFNSASSLTDPALELARCCLSLIKDGNPEIEKELDLISALQILSAFDLGVIPIQVRLCEDRMVFIEDCLKVDPNAYLASHKLLKLAKLLRIAGDDEQTREGRVLQLVGETAIGAGPAGCSAATDAARRLAALRYAPAANLLSHVAKHAHADRATRRDLFAAAVAHCDAHSIEDMLRARLELELEGLQQMGVALKEHSHISERCPSTDDEFADAITTPVIEKKDLVPTPPDRKLPLFNYLMDTFQNKFASGDRTSTTDTTDRSVHCQEFYHSLYESHEVSDAHYRYDTFSIQNGEAEGRGHNALKWFYMQNCTDNGGCGDLEAEVVQKCAEEMLYKDTPLCVACLLRSTQDFTQTKRLIETQNTETAVSAALYATLMKCNAPELRDNVYLTKPSKMARTTLKQKNASEEQLEIIRQCIEKLTVMSEVDLLRKMGLEVDALLYNTDEEYRQEKILDFACSTNKEHIQLALSLAAKYHMDVLEVWIQYALMANSLSELSVDTLPSTDAASYKRIHESLWRELNGQDHNSLIQFFTFLKSINEEHPISGLTAAEHIKLLKKAKAACSQLDYKLLLEQPSDAEFLGHIMQIANLENIELLSKFLRSLPAALKIPISTIKDIYSHCLNNHFFSEPLPATNKMWMQRYRQCASYFNKLSKNNLLEFIDGICFSGAAIIYVPSGTRHLILMQAIDYCEQEQENNYKFTDNDQTWTQVGQELTRWARFLENFQSTTVQGIIENINVVTVRDFFWTTMEGSHGDTDVLIPLLGELVLRQESAAVLGTLLQCLQVDVTLQQVLLHVALHSISVQDIQTLVTCLTQYHKDGVKLSDDLLDKVMEKATELGLPPHRQIALLSLRTRSRPSDAGQDLRKIALFTVDLLRSEWPGDCNDLTEEDVLSEEGRRGVLSKFMVLAHTWQQKKALVDVLACWPPSKDGGAKSLHCDYLHALLSNSHPESLVLIKLLLQRPLLVEEEVKWLADKAAGDAVINAIWILVLSKCDNYKDDVLNLVQKHKESLQSQEIEDELIKELLDSGMFIKLVSTPIYSSIIKFIINREANEANYSEFTMAWAINELVKANYLAEAGHLQMIAIGVPTSLRGFSQSVLFGKNIFK